MEYDDDTRHDLEELQNEFKRKELLTHALGPSVSLIIHIVMFLALFFLVKSQFHEEEDDIQIEVVKEASEEVIDTPDNLDEITQTDLQSSEAAENDAPVEEAPDEVNTDVNDISIDIPDSDVLAFTTDVSSPFKTRTLQGKAVQVAKGGGDKRALSTVLAALKWLRRNQNPDGSWGDKQSKVGLTGLVTLLYLAHGETPSSKHFGRTVQKSLRWLTKQVKILKPKYQDTGQRQRKYGLAMAVYAISEGYSLTGIGDLKTAMDEGVQSLLDGINPNGWVDYQSYTHNDQCMSITAWYWQAFKAAYLAGCDNKKMKSYIKTIPDKVMSNGYDVYDPNAKNGSKGRVINSFAYRVAEQFRAGNFYGHMGGDPIQQSSANRAIGALMLQLFGEKEKALPAARVIAKEDFKRLRFDYNQGFSMYSWYYATQVMYNNKSRDMTAWKRWNQRFQTVLYENQHKDGYWQTPGTRSEIGFFLGEGIDKKVYSTALAGLMLTVYYRYLPTTKLLPPKSSRNKTADSQEIDLDFL